MANVFTGDLGGAYSAFPNVPTFVGMHDDFTGGTALATKWLYTQVATGTAAILTADTTSINGICQFSSVDTTSDKGANIQWTPTTVAPFAQFQDSKDHYFSMRFSVSSITDKLIAMGGLYVADTSPIASLPSDGLFLYKPTASAALSLYLYAGSALVNSWPIATLVNATYVEIGVAVTTITSGAGTLTAYLNGSQIVSSSITGLPTTKALAPGFGAQSGTSPGAAVTANLDWISAWKTR